MHIRGQFWNRRGNGGAWQGLSTCLMLLVVVYCSRGWSHNYNENLFESGTRDLRDVSLSAYKNQVTEYFVAFVKFRESFKNTDSPLRLVHYGSEYTNLHFHSIGKHGDKYRAHSVTAKRRRTWYQDVAFLRCDIGVQAELWLASLRLHSQGWL